MQNPALSDYTANTNSAFGLYPYITVLNGKIYYIANDLYDQLPHFWEVTLPSTINPP